MNNDHNEKYDLIGDIHGHAGELRALLAKLGYREDGGAFRHPERRAIFLGDYIDRGPRIREVLEIVRAMVEAGSALALMGNHEWNALRFHTRDRHGEPLRPRSHKNVQQHAATLAAFDGDDAAWSGWLEWFHTLPLWLELPGFRAVHACWAEEAFGALDGARHLDLALLHTSARSGRAEHEAVRALLTGREVMLPDGHQFTDKTGHAHDDIRVAWWLDGRGLTYRELVVPPGSDAPDLLAPDDSLAFAPYPADAKPVFIGHYWLPPEDSPFFAPNVVCLDHSVGRRGGQLSAYRWDGEAAPDVAKVVTVPQVGV